MDILAAVGAGQSPADAHTHLHAPGRVCKHARRSAAASPCASLGFRAPLHSASSLGLIARADDLRSSHSDRFAPVPHRSFVSQPAATPLAVKPERREQRGEALPIICDLGATPSSGKENGDAFHRLSALQVGKDSSPNTAAAEATAIAGIAALTQLSRQERRAAAEESGGEEFGGRCDSESDASSQYPTISECSAEEECAAGALMALISNFGGQRNRNRKRPRSLDIDPSASPTSKPKKGRGGDSASARRCSLTTASPRSGGRRKGSTSASSTAADSAKSLKAASSRRGSASSRRSGGRAGGGGGKDEAMQGRDGSGAGGGRLGVSSAAASLVGNGSLGSRADVAMAAIPNSGRNRKPCNCKNSKCLKLYCECFAAGVYCEGACKFFLNACHRFFFDTGFL
jgi:hypothetical protein